MAAQSEIPEDVMKAAEEALDNLLCNCKESCGGTYEGVRAASIADIASAIMAERERKLTALSTDAEPVAAQWRTRFKGGAWDAWENGRAPQQLPAFMEAETRSLYAAPPAPSVAVRAFAKSDEFVKLTNEYLNNTDNDHGARMREDIEMFVMDNLQEIKDALSAQVQDVAGWQSIDGLKPDHGKEVLGWVEVCGKFCTQPIYYSAFSRTWRRKLDGVEVDEVTHYQPLPAAPAAKQEA